MQDITMYSSNELSLMVFNDEYLCNIRHKSYLMETLKQYFVFTDRQEEVLLQDLEEDLEGMIINDLRELKNDKI